MGTTEAKLWDEQELSELLHAAAMGALSTRVGTLYAVDQLYAEYNAQPPGELSHQTCMYLGQADLLAAMVCQQEGEARAMQVQEWCRKALAEADKTRQQGKLRAAANEFITSLWAHIEPTQAFAVSRFAVFGADRRTRYYVGRTAPMSPWGEVQEEVTTPVGTPLGDRFVVDKNIPAVAIAVTTASHGGIWVDQRLVAQYIPRELLDPNEVPALYEGSPQNHSGRRQPGYWFEEDCQASIPLWFVLGDKRDVVRKSLRMYHSYDPDGAE